MSAANTSIDRKDTVGQAKGAIVTTRFKQRVTYLSGQQQVIVR